MAGFFWNIRGFNKSIKQEVVRNWSRNNNMQFGCLIETRVKERKARKIVSEVFAGWDSMTNYEHHNLGRIWVVWQQSVRMSPVYKSSQIITCSILMEGVEEEFFCSFIYAANGIEERKELWDDLRSHYDSPMFKDKNWMIMGDFNEILDIEEHSGFASSPRLPGGMRDFQEIASYCGLTDMGYQGPKFTWCNKREEGLICKKLDRVLINERWLHSSRAYCVFEPGGCSDHLRCRIQLVVEETRKRKPFKFTNCIAKMPEFLPLMEENWRGNEALFHSTTAMFKLTKQLKALKQPLRLLCKDKLGDLPKKTREAFKTLCEKQKATLEQPLASAIREEAAAYERWQRLAYLEEEFYKQRSKLHWLDVGDGNNRVFHNAIKVREVRNGIREVMRADGTLAKTDEEIKVEAEGFFSQFLNAVPEDFEGVTVERLRELLGFQCSEIDCGKLVKEVTKEEIKEVLFKMPGHKSPGPDGYTSEFFKETWQIIGDDVTIAVQSFFIKGFLPKGLNSTILALIPKTTEAKIMKDYRPISCCNVLYKIISKLLANRLKGILPKCISWNQSAFIKERLLMENVLLATEIVKDYHREDISPRCAMMIDISKAFDSVQWSFLLNTLQALGLPEKFIKWISLCITTASFSVQVNGELAGYFQSNRGLRQGCSLSPYLFVICMNVLSKMLDEAAARNLIGFHPKCKNIGLTHLCFADDLMVFIEGSRRSVEGILRVFEEFDKMSGLKISLEKSTLFMAGFSDQKRAEIVSHFPLASGNLPVRYLGLPLLTKNMSVNDFLPLVEKIRKRIGSWTGRFLSYAGRLQLINSVIMSLVNFWMAAFRLPSGCIQEIERICSAFLWSGVEMNSRKTKISWKEVCRTKQEGGLGIRSLKEMNVVCILKLIWRILAAKSLWVSWIKMYLIRKGSFWSIKDTSQLGSWTWRKILKYREKAKELYRVEVRNGERASFWYDKWSPLGCLKDLLGNGGCIDMGLTENAKVADCRCHRRKNHRFMILNRVEQEIEKFKVSWRQDEEDVYLWRSGNNKFKEKFSTAETWQQIREQHQQYDWHKAVWFKHATPKYSFVVWVALRDRLSTGSRMAQWSASVDTSCIFCQVPVETVDHLFFECSYSKQIWEKLARGVLRDRFTSSWSDIRRIIVDEDQEKMLLFTIRYVFQTAVHSIWRERNRRRHGEAASPYALIAKLIDKTMRNKFSIIQKKGDKRLAGGLQYWFSTR